MKKKYLIIYYTLFNFFINFCFYYFKVLVYKILTALILLFLFV